MYLFFRKISSQTFSLAARLTRSPTKKRKNVCVLSSARYSIIVRVVRKFPHFPVTHIEVHIITTHDATYTKFSEKIVWASLKPCTPKFSKLLLVGNSIIGFNETYSLFIVQDRVLFHYSHL